LAGSIDFQQLVNATRGFSGAEVVAVCNEAALHAIDRDAEVLTQEDILMAASKIKPQITIEMLRFYSNFANKNR
jgi:AAA family ATPase